MDPNGVVFDLSSDEEVGWGGDIGVGVGVGGDDFGWIQKLLDEVDKDSDDSDDVVVVGEVVGNPKPKSKNCNTVVKSLDDDDDCVILDGDPDKSVAIQNNQVVDESDELLVVGETGQVACRDYPHPRHLCAKFPFTSTPHERHCNQCHCYVCDSLAPCLHWGTGISSSDHCHATEKEESWKHQRKCLKNSNKATISVPKPSYASISTGLTQISQVLVSTPLEPYYVTQGEVPASIRACTRATNFGIPNITNQSRSQLSGCVMPRNNFQPNLVSQQLQHTGNNVISRDRRRVVGNLGPQLNTPPAVFKRAGSHGVALMSNPKYISSDKRYGNMRYPHSVSTLGDNNSMRWQHFHNQMSLESITRLSSQPNMHANPSNFVPSQPQVSSQPNMHTNPLNSVPSHPQLSSQPNVASILLNSVPTHQPMVSPQQNIGNFFVNSVASQPQVPSQAYVGGMFLRSMSSQPQVSSHPTIGNSFANTVPSESQVGDSQLNYASSDYQKFFAEENQSHNFLDTSLTDIDSSWVTPTSQSSQQPTAENSQLQDVDSIKESSSLAGIDTLFSGSTDPVSLDFEYDNWTLDHHDVPIPSPGPTLTDSGIFFRL